MKLLHSLWVILFLIMGLLPASAKNAAIIICNSDYERQTDLKNSPKQDGELLGAALARAGFEFPLNQQIKSYVAAGNIEREISEQGKCICYNLEKREIKMGLSKIKEKLQNEYDFVLVYYSGHGAHYDGEDILLGIDEFLGKNSSETDYSTTGLKIEHIVDYCKPTGSNKTGLLFLFDACRIGGKESSSAPQAGVVKAFSAKPGTIAYGGDNGTPSPFIVGFTEAILRGDSISQALVNADQKVTSAGKQSAVTQARHGDKILAHKFFETPQDHSKQEQTNELEPTHDIVDAEEVQQQPKVGPEARPCIIGTDVNESANIRASAGGAIIGKVPRNYLTRRGFGTSIATYDTKSEGGGTFIKVTGNGWMIERNLTGAYDFLKSTEEGLKLIREDMKIRDQPDSNQHCFAQVKKHQVVKDLGETKEVGKYRYRKVEWSGWMTKTTSAGSKIIEFSDSE